MMKMQNEEIAALVAKYASGVRFDALCHAAGVASREEAAELMDGLARALRAGSVGFADGLFCPRPQGGPVTMEDATGDLARILEKYNLPEKFPDKVIAEAAKCRQAEEREIKKRKKVEGWIITIDSETAKDLDDAVSVEVKEDGWELGVHIADVSFYVPQGSLLDKEARTRGTSVYLISHVIPMFPHELSDDLCSLNADREKLAFSAFIRISRGGEVASVRFERTVIRVSRRCSYNEVEKILRGARDADAKKLKTMAELARILRKRRLARGGLEFEVPEVRIQLDAGGQPTGVRVPVRGEAEMLIEDFMLAANEQVARFLAQKGASLFRIHASPDEEKLASFVKFADSVGLRLRLPKENNPREMQHLLDVVRESPSAAVLSSLLLRSMQKAVYSTDNPGHFGLAFSDYTHFTSPIRRYPDVIVHRLLAAAVTRKKAYAAGELSDIADQATRMEQNAVDAEREYVRLKGARFLATRIGETVPGRITSVTSWGMFITLLPYGLDGLLHVSELRDDYYQLDAFGHTLVGSRTKNVYTIGAEISILIKSVNAEKGFVDLALAGAVGEQRGSRRKGRQPERGANVAPAAEAAPRDAAASGRQRTGTKNKPGADVKAQATGVKPAAGEARSSRNRRGSRKGAPAAVAVPVVKQDVKSTVEQSAGNKPAPGRQRGKADASGRQARQQPARSGANNEQKKNVKTSRPQQGPSANANRHDRSQAAGRPGDVPRAGSGVTVTRKTAMPEAEKTGAKPAAEKKSSGWRFWKK